MKKKILKRMFSHIFKLVALAYMLTGSANAQSTNGAMDYDIPNIAYDRFGKAYSLKELTMGGSGQGGPSANFAVGSPAGQNVCNAGFFVLDFVDPANTGFNNTTTGPALRAVICQVFTDLSVLIIPANNPYTNAPNQLAPLVNIRVTSTNGLPANVIAGASSFYNRANQNSWNANSPFQNGVLDGEVWKTINTGFDSWYAFYYVFAPAFYHGFIDFNVNQFPNFCTNLANPCNNPQIDLYQVTLHEITHALGFNSFISSTGASVQTGSTFYTRFDTHLNLSGTDYINTPWQCGNLGYNTGASVTSGCATQFTGATAGTQPVFAPGTYLPGSSMSHFDASCSGLPYIMNPFNTTGCVRHYTSEEVGALCDIGYHTTTQFGTNAANLCVNQNYTSCGMRVAGADDIFQYSTFNTTPTPYNLTQGTGPIVLNDFLNNDEDEYSGSGIPTNYECATIIKGGGSMLTGLTTITYTPDPNFVGFAVIRYNPVNIANNVHGNFAYIFIRVLPACPNGCNMIAGGDFDIVSPINYGASPYSFLNVGTMMTFPPLPPFSGSPDWIGFNGSWREVPNGPSSNPWGCGGSAAYPPSYNGSTTNSYFSLVNYLNSNTEGLVLDLCSPMQPGGSYRLTFWAMAKNSACIPNLNVRASDHMPCIPPTLTTVGSNTCDGVTFNVVSVVSQPLTGAWQQYTVNFTYSGTVPAQHLMVYPDGISGAGPAYVDEFQLMCVPQITNVAVQPCPGQCTGSINITTIGCSGPYTYLWSNTSTSEDQTGLCAGTYTVTVTDTRGCTSQATVTLVDSPCQPYTLTKTANYNQTYAGQPITYTITVFNPNTTTQSVILEDILPPTNYFTLLTSPVGWPGFPASASVTLNPGNNTFVYQGYFTINGICPDGNHTNTVNMTAGGQQFTADKCVTILYGCPMISYGLSDCVFQGPVPVTLGVHTHIPNIERMKVWINYPQYISPPAPGNLTAADITEQFAGANIIFGGATPSTIGSPVFVSNISGTDYYKVLLDVYYTSPVTVVGPYSFATVNFTYTTPIPPCQTSYLCWVTSPSMAVTPDYHTDLYQNASGSPTFTPWTQAAHINFVGCPGCPVPDATFLVQQTSCDIHGCVTVTGNNTSSTAVHMWEFGDNRSTPFNGAQTTTWCYMDPYTDNFGNTSAGVPPGVYTITHTVIDNGQVGSETQTITVTGACCTAPLTIADGTNSSSLGSSLSGQTIDVEGLFIIDNNFSIASCNVTMESGAEILISTGNNLSIKYTQLTGCNFMWKGITIEDKSALSTYQTYIADAQYAVYAKDGSSFKIGYTYFDNNYVGLYVPPSSLGYNTISGAVFASDFTQNGSFKPFYAGQTPQPGTKSFAGIYVNDWTLVMSGSNTLTHFSNLNNGIVSKRCNLYVTECDFKNIYRDTYYGNAYDGSGIYASGGHGFFTIKQSGFGNSTSSATSFENCQIGIFTERMNTSVRANYMKNVNYGVRDWRGSYLHGSTYDNLIDCNYIGIDLRFNDGSYGTTATRNKIKLGYNPLFSGKSMAIRVQDYGSSVSNTSVTFNVIDMNKGSFGIYSANSKKITVMSNMVNMNNSTWNYMGISQYGCDKSFVGCNGVYSAGISSNTYQTGIYTSISPGTTLECNTVDHTYNGFRFDGASNSSNITTNSINNHTYGMYYGTTAITDPEFDKGNTWNGTYGLAGAIHTGNYLLSRYYVNPFGSPYLPPSLAPSSGWFLGSSVASAVCTPTITCTPKFDLGDISSTEIAVAATDVATPDYKPETNWMADKFLYEKLMKDPTLTNGNSILETFLNDKQNTSVGGFNVVQADLDNLLATTPGFEVQLSQNAVTIEQKLVAIEANITLLQQAGLTSAQEQIIMLANEVLQGDIKQLQTALETLINPLLANKDAMADNIKMTNGLISSPEVYEQNQKVVNEIYLQTIAKDVEEFTTQQVSELYAIASQCALAGGDAVYKARALYSLIDDNVLFDDFVVCAQLGIQLRKASGASATQGKVLDAPMVVPNPANTYADILFAPVEDGKVKLSVFDKTGRVIKVMSLNQSDDKARIELDEFSSGIYFVQISSLNKISARSKLTVIK